MIGSPFAQSKNTVLIRCTLADTRAGDNGRTDDSTQCRGIDPQRSKQTETEGVRGARNDVLISVADVPNVIEHMSNRLAQLDVAYPSTDPDDDISGRRVDPRTAQPNGVS
jgi:hypothetical protein